MYDKSVEEANNKLKRPFSLIPKSGNRLALRDKISAQIVPEFLDHKISSNRPSQLFPYMEQMLHAYLRDSVQELPVHHLSVHHHHSLLALVTWMEGRVLVRGIYIYICMLTQDERWPITLRDGQWKSS